MADIKNLLKEARKLIDEKKYPEAQEVCKNILRKDKQNYLGLVLLGKSLQDTDQAPLAFQRAISCKRDHPLAWQGLVSYYEKNDTITNKIKLISIFEQMLTLQLEEDKVVELLTKLGQLGCSLKNSQVITILIKYLATDPDVNLSNFAEQQLLQILHQDVPCLKDDSQLLIKVLNKIYEKSPGNSSVELIIAKNIAVSVDKHSALEIICSLPYFSSNKQIREWICYYLFSLYVEENSYCDFDVEKYFDKLVEGIEDYKYAGLLKSLLSFKNKLYLDAYKQCIPLLNYLQPEKVEAVYIIRCTMMLKKWAITEKLVINFLKITKNEEFCNELKKYLFLSLAKQNKWKKAVLAMKDISVDSLTVDEQAIFTECLIEIGECVDDMLEKLSATKYFMPLQALVLLKRYKYNDIVALLENKSFENALNYFYLGVAFWELKNYDKCHIYLLKSAKIDPTHAHTFLYLGYFYQHHICDLEKAKKCYEKAYSINALDNNIAKNLSECYAKLNLKDLDYDLLISFEDSELKDKSWVNFRLGLHYLNKRNWESAINKFRNVIKTDSQNATAFECLADAYYLRGSYTSALRAYNKVISLNPSKTPYCKTRIGYIYSVLTQYENAIATFEEVLNIEPHSILAIKGISETWMRIAHKKISYKMYGTARDCAQFSVKYTIKGLKLQNQFSSLWKMLGDTLLFITKLPNKYSYVYIEGLLFENKENPERKEKLDIFPHAITCYSHVIKYKKQSSSYDLSLAYLDLYRESKKLVNCQISFNLTLTCLKKKPSSWRNWNLLGKICLHIKKYNLAQHCFIKALLVTRKWSVAKIWCNLGTLYLKLQLYKLANYCYWRGQSTLPSYTQSWIGQALIAEVIREEEAMDLFRHASRLGFHPESALGYADWVCRTLRSNEANNSEYKYVIDGLHAITYATDLVQWFCCYKTDNACAYTMLGILQERCGLLKSAMQSYEKAYAIIPTDTHKKNIVLLNLGRIFLRLKQYDDAIKIFQFITEASLDSACGLALALFKNGLFEEAYATYETVLFWLSTDENEKADVLVAMSGIAHTFKGPDDAKTLLFQSIQVAQKKPTPYSLFAISSLGLLHSDQNLSKLALSELQKYSGDVKYGFDIGFIKSYTLVLHNKIEEAIISISNSIHDHPASACLWFCMAQYCLNTSCLRPKAASASAQRAMCLSRNSNQNQNIAKMLAIASVAEHLDKNYKKAMTLAKKGLHMYPQKSEIWAALVFSLLTNNTYIDKKVWILYATKHMRRHLEISRNLSRWIGFVEKRLSK